MPESSPQTIPEAVTWLRDHFDAEGACGLSAIYQFDLAGPAGGALVVRIDDGKAEIREGSEPSRDVAFRLDACDYWEILAGRENVDLLIMKGRLEIDGDLRLASKVRRIFRRS